MSEVETTMETLFDSETQEDIVEIFRINNGELKKITFEEYQKEMQKSQEVQQKIQKLESEKQEGLSERAGRVVSVNYKEEAGNFYYEKPAKKVSSIVDGGKAGGSITSTQSVTREVGLNLGIEFPLNRIGLSLGASFNVAESRTSEISHTVNVPPNTKAYLTFSPRMYYSRGNAEICREIRQGHGEYEVVCQDKRNTEMFFPVHVDGSHILDGIYRLKRVK